MDRRTFLALLSCAAVTPALPGCGTPASAGALLGSAGHEATAATPAPVLSPPPAAPPALITPGPISKLPGTGDSLALTIDDGANAAVVGAYAAFARETGARLTFFVTAAFPGWTIHRDVLRPLVDSGQIQLANHSWDHPDLTRLSPAGIAAQLTRCGKFLADNFGVNGAPFYRPPFGRRNAMVDRVAADLGYLVPTMWEGSLSDSGLITTDYLLQCARTYFRPQALIIGHANHPPVTQVFGQLTALILERQLRLRTLNDVVRLR